MICKPAIASTQHRPILRELMFLDASRLATPYSVASAAQTTPSVAPLADSPPRPQGNSVGNAFGRKEGSNVFAKLSPRDTCMKESQPVGCCNVAEAVARLVPSVSLSAALLPISSYMSLNFLKDPG